MVKMESRNAFQMTIAAHSVHILRLFFLYAIAKAGASIKIQKKNSINADDLDNGNSLLVKTVVFGIISG